MAAIRPRLDAHLLGLLRGYTFAARDFFETRAGVCRVTPPLTHELAETAPRWGSWSDGWQRMSRRCWTPMPRHRSAGGGEAPGGRRAGTAGRTSFREGRARGGRAHGVAGWLAEGEARAARGVRRLCQVGQAPRMIDAGVQRLREMRAAGRDPHTRRKQRQNSARPSASIGGLKRSGMRSTDGMATMRHSGGISCRCSRVSQLGGSRARRGYRSATAE